MSGERHELQTGFDMARRDPWFWHCVSEAMDTPEFLAQWRSLRGYQIARSPIEAMVDKACGVEQERAQEFIRDVYDTIYTRIPRPSMTEAAGE